MATHHTNTTRRAVLATIGTAAAALPLMAGAAVAAHTGADAELLALAAQLEDVYAKIEQINVERIDPTEEAHDVVIKTRNDYPAGKVGEKFWWEAMCRFGKESGRDAAQKEVTALYNIADPLVIRMWEIEPRTNAGRAAKVRILVNHVMGGPEEIWTGVDAGLDWDKAMCRRLLYQLAGLDMITGEVASGGRA